MQLPGDWAIFPLFQALGGGKCACGNPSCTLAGKHPEYPFSLLEKGQKIRGVEGRNYGIATGERSGIFVVDLDCEGAVQWAYERGLIDTYTVATGREIGCQLYFRWPGFPVKNSASAIFPGVDIRGDGGFVVAPGSRHKSGRVYDPLDENAEIKDAPPWLLEWPGLRGVDRARGAGAAAGANAPIPCEGEELVRRTPLAIEYLKNATPAIEGQGGHDALWKVALHLVRRLELPLEECDRLIDHHYNRRCSPAWSEQEIWHKLEEARDKSELPTGIAPDGFGEFAKSPTQALLEGLSKKANGLGTPEDPVPEPAKDLEKIEFPTLVNILHRHHAWRGVFRFDVLARRAVAVNPPLPMRMETGSLSAGDLGAVRMWLSNPPADSDGETAGCGFNVSGEMVKEAVRTLAERHPFNPFAQWLDSLPKVDTVRELDRVHETILKSPDGAVCSAVFKKMLVAAVRRARAAGTSAKVDHQTVMVLVGAQGIGKGRFLRALGGRWYTALTGDISNKDTIIKLQGSVVVEMEELATKKRADQDALKAFLSASDDFERRPYAEDAERVMRSYVLFGSANDPELTDPTGNRRFAMITLSSVDIERAQELIPTLWAEADLIAATNFDHHLTPDEMSSTKQLAKAHEEIDPWVSSIQSWLAGKVWVKGTEEIFLECICRGENGAKLLKFDRGIQRRIGDVMRHLGCKKSWPKPGNPSVKGWKVPEEVSNCTPGTEEETARAAMSLEEKAKLLAKN